MGIHDAIATALTALAGNWAAVVCARAWYRASRSPSPLRVLPSSQFSFGSTMPLPQRPRLSGQRTNPACLDVARGVAAVGVVLFAVVALFVLSLMPLPHSRRCARHRAGKTGLHCRAVRRAGHRRLPCCCHRRSRSARGCHCRTWRKAVLAAYRSNQPRSPRQSNRHHRPRCDCHRHRPRAHSRFRPALLARLARPLGTSSQAPRSSNPRCSHRHQPRCRHRRARWLLRCRRRTSHTAGRHWA